MRRPQGMTNRGAGPGVGLLEVRNLKTGYARRSDYHWLWSLVFGPLYFAWYRVWLHAILAGALAILSLGASWLVYPFFARRILRRYYLRTGWEDISRG